MLWRSFYWINGLSSLYEMLLWDGAILAFAEASHASVKHYDSSHAKGLPKTPVTLDLLVGLMAELQA